MKSEATRTTHLQSSPPFRYSTRAALQEINSLHRIFSVNPIFGVDFKEEEDMPSLEQLKVARVDDDVEIVDDDTNNAFAAYFADGAEKTEREITFNEDIGLACETLPDGWTMQSLWKG